MSANGSGPAGRTLSWTPSRPDFTTAEMVEEVRELVVAAWERGESPDYLEVTPPVLELLSRMKDREIRRGVPIVLVGLIVH
jgi:hypothetical protein